MTRTHIVGVGAALIACLIGSGCSSDGSASRAPAPERTRSFAPDAARPVDVAVLLGPDAEVVDFAGPWGVFEYANAPDRQVPAFRLFTVAETAGPVLCSGGMRVVPDYTFTNAPQARIVVVPAMGEPSPAMLEWVRRASAGADLTMSVCNGSFVLAKAGLLSGRTVTAHHGAYGALAAEYPDITVRRGARFVDTPGISTAGGLTSGIDLALHVVELFYGRETAERTARDLEYQGTGWRDPDSNRAYAARPVSTDAHPICPVCEMEVDPATKITELRDGKRILFCSEQCKRTFDKAPEKFRDP